MNVQSLSLMLHLCFLLQISLVFGLPKKHHAPPPDNNAPPVPAGQYPLPIPFTGPAAASPPHSIDYQDISIIRRVADDTWFRFSKANKTGKGLDVATATNFSGPWYYSYSALDGKLLDPVAKHRKKTHLWTPEVHFWNGLYYLYYSVYASHEGKGVGFDIALATSPNMTKHSWTDHGSVGIPAPPVPKGKDDPVPYIRIGQSVLRNASSPDTIDPMYKVITYGDSRSGIWGMELGDNLTALAGGKNDIIIADQWTNGTGDLAGNKSGASFPLSYGGYIYLFYSVGACCAKDGLPWDTGYHIEVCRTNYTEGPWGQYFDREGNNCLTGSANRTGTVVQWSNSPEVYLPGSVGVTLNEQEQLVMYYQYRNISAAKTEGLRMGYNYLNFDQEGWPVLST